MILAVSLLSSTIRFVLIGMLCFLWSACSNQREEELFFHGRTMGTSYSVKIFLNSPFFSLKTSDSEKESIRQGIEHLLKSINQEMSTYMQDSKISVFNKSPVHAWFTISSHFGKLMETSLYMSKETKGAFDVTIGPLVNLWGFGPQERKPYAPSEEEVKKIKAFVGMQYLELRKNLNYQIRKLKKGVYLDLSAIAKGYGVDAVAKFIESLGHKNYLVEIGGELRSGGLRKGKPWRIAIEEASMMRGRVGIVIGMENMSLASSGDYRNYYEVEGKKFSHVIDPRTAHPIDHSLAAVSVLHEDCMWADAWATALLVLGEKEGYQLALRKKLSAIFFIREAEGFRRKETPNFQRYRKKYP